jgi:GxxExxY protein
MDQRLTNQDLTGQILGCFYRVYNTLGYGFLEKVYEKALAIELRKHNLSVACQEPIAVYYEGEMSAIILRTSKPTPQLFSN